MTDSPILAALRQHVRAGGRLRLFLDYDGTLVPIAPTPEQAVPDPPLLDLLARVAGVPVIRAAVVSGRPLAWLQRMLPVPGLTLAGVYGLEVQIAGQPPELETLLGSVRPVVVRVKMRWAELVGDRPGFLVEDKGLAVALHARWAEPGEAEAVLDRARAAAGDLIPPDTFRLLGGDRFLEAAPKAAGKGRAIEALFDRVSFPGAVPVYFGDDDKDEEAFEAVRGRGGYPIGVGSRFPLPTAAERLPGPETVRHWLGVLWHDWVHLTRQETHR